MKSTKLKENYIDLDLIRGIVKKIILTTNFNSNFYLLYGVFIYLLTDLIVYVNYVVLHNFLWFTLSYFVCIGQIFRSILYVLRFYKNYSQMH